MERAMATPASATLSQAGWDRSKARTLWPALCRLMAMGPPMLPTPMYPTFKAILPKKELVVSLYDGFAAA